MKSYMAISIVIFLSACATPEQRMIAMQDNAMKMCDPEITELINLREKAIKDKDNIMLNLSQGVINDHIKNPVVRNCIQSAINNEMQIRMQQALMFNYAMQQSPQLFYKPPIVQQAPMVNPVQPDLPKQPIVCTPQGGTFMQPSIVCQ